MRDKEEMGAGRLAGQEAEGKNDVAEANPVSEFLWRCAGADVELLRRCPGSQSRYTGMGSTIVFTALMAWASCGYALYYVFDSQTLAVVFGLLWALMIFSLDRFIVNSIPDTAGTGVRLLYGLPRFAMAVLIGIVISAPIEMKIFEKEISVKVLELGKQDTENFAMTEIRDADDAKSDKKKAEMGFQAADSTLRARMNNIFPPEVQKNIDEQQRIINTCEQKIKKNNGELRQVKDKLAQLHEDVSQDAEQKKIDFQNKVDQLNKSKSSEERKKAKAQSEINRLKRESRLAAEQHANEARQEKAAKDSTFAAKDGAKEAEMNRYASKASVAENGIAMRLRALHAIMGDDSHSGKAVIFIMLLFILVEVAPTLLKVFLPAGAYEKMHEALEYDAKAEAERMMSEVNIKVDSLLAEARQEGDMQVESSKLVNQKMFDELAAAQAEVIREAINSWKETEMQRARLNPEEFLKGGSLAEQRGSQKKQE